MYWEDVCIGAMPLIMVGAAFALPLVSHFVKRAGFCHGYAVFWSLTALVSTSYTMVEVGRVGKPVLYSLGGWPPPLGIAYEVDALGALFALLSASIIFLSIVYSVWYSRISNFGDRSVWYYTLLLLLDGGLIGCFYTGDVFNLFVMMEVVCIASYALVAFYRSRLVALEAAMKYGVIGAAATTVYFLAVALLYLNYGTLNMADLALRARALHTILGTELSVSNLSWLALNTLAAFVLSLWTFMYLSAIFPNHFWLPDAHPEAPTPVSAVLSGVVVNLGVYAAMRFFYTIFGPSSILGSAVMGYESVRDIVLQISMVLGAVTCLLGAVMMNAQRDVKRLLAYSTISHMGLLFSAVSLGLSNVPEYARVLAVAAVAYHVVNHSVGKALLFLSSGIYIATTGSRNMERWRSYSRSNMALAGMVAGSLNLLGVPPLGGFFSKLMLMQAFLACGQTWLAIVLIAASAISLPAYIKMLSSAASPTSGSRCSAPAAIALVVLIAACISLGILYVLGYAHPLFTTFSKMSVSSTGVENYIKVAKIAAEELITVGR